MLTARQCAAMGWWSAARAVTPSSRARSNVRPNALRERSTPSATSGRAVPARPTCNVIKGSAPRSPRTTRRTLARFRKVIRQVRSGSIQRSIARSAATPRRTVRRNSLFAWTTRSWPPTHAKLSNTARPRSSPSDAGSRRLVGFSNEFSPQFTALRRLNWNRRRAEAPERALVPCASGILVTAARRLRARARFFECATTRP
jgi:hypothetical protein